LKRDTRLPVIAIQVDKDKISRAYAITPTCEAGRVFLPERAPWIEEFLDELMMFPAGPHDDQVDSFTQALEYLNRPMPGQGWLDYVEGTVKRMEAEDRAGWDGPREAYQIKI
jgi:phage terminase large subunit-like protein